MWECLFVIKRWSQCFYLCIWGVWDCGIGELVGSRCVEFLRELIVKVRPRQASMLVCVVLIGTREGLVSPRVLVWTRYRCCGTEWSCGIVIVEILHSIEGGDVEQGCSNLEIILPCLRLLISLSLTCIYISCMLIFISLYTWYILHSIDICLGLFAHACIQLREP